MRRYRMALLALAMAAFQWWLRSPTWPRTVLVMLTVGVGLATKFSFPLFFGIGAVTLMVAAKKWPLAKGVVALVGAFAIVDAVYFFTKLPLFFKGFKELMQHNALDTMRTFSDKFATLVGGITFQSLWPSRRQFRCCCFRPSAPGLRAGGDTLKSSSSPY